jgi:curved DNA-binding protein CbpA
MTANPFAVLGLPERPDLDDETVRAAWRAIAAATHPDRADGGDLARYTAATAAYADLRTPWARSEAYADLRDAAGDTSPLPVVTDSGPVPGPLPPPPAFADARQLPARIWHGRRLHLAARALAAALLSVAVLNLIPGQPAEPAVITGLVIWFVLTSRGDLAPPPGQ